jgi:hypothetical protein
MGRGFTPPDSIRTQPGGVLTRTGLDPKLSGTLPP